MIKTIGTVCVMSAIILDSLSYYKQIAKTLHTKKSAQVSTSSYLYKIAKAIFAMGGLMIYTNWVGFSMEVFMMIVYIVSLLIIMKYKPKKWGLFK